MQNNNGQPISIVFFGTHDFAKTILQGLIDSPFVSVDLVITQPDKPVGRKKELTASPVKQLAEKHHISIEQPASLKSYTLPDTFDLGVTAQYGLIIPEHILDAPKKGILNVHTSLLPAYRGASPIQSALIDGKKQTGVTIMKMDKGMDTGPILLQKTIDIAPDDTYLPLQEKMAQIGRDALLKAISGYMDGALVPTPQDDSEASVCKQLSREDGRIDWGKSADSIYNQYRGMTPWPGVWTTWNGKRLKLLRIRPAEKDIAPGKVDAEHDTLYIGTASDAIEVLDLQLEGKKSMDAKMFVNGYQDIKGATLS